MCPWNCIFNFFNYKNLFRPVWCVSFSKNIFVFINYNTITNFEFRLLVITFFLKINIYIYIYIYILYLTSTGFIFIVLRYVLLYSRTISSNLLIYTFFDTEVTYLLILVFNILINLSTAADFHSICIEFISTSLSFNHSLKKIL